MIAIFVIWDSFPPLAYYPGPREKWLSAFSVQQANVVMDCLCAFWTLGFVEFVTAVIGTSLGGCPKTPLQARTG